MHSILPQRGSPSTDVRHKVETWAVDLSNVGFLHSIRTVTAEVSVHAAHGNVGCSAILKDLEAISSLTLQVSRS